MYMVTKPKIYDVIVTTNMFGDIITDLGAAIQGGMGMAASGNLNPTRQTASMFEPVHGSAPDIAGKGFANPIATFLSVAMMLDFLGQPKAADGDQPGVPGCRRRPEEPHARSGRDGVDVAGRRRGRGEGSGLSQPPIQETARIVFDDSHWRRG